MNDTATIQGYRLSSQQERVWLMEQVEGRPICRVRCEVLIRGPLDHKRLETALAEIVARHEILRTGFSIFPGMSNPLQIIREPEWVPLEIHRDGAEDGHDRPRSMQQADAAAERQQMFTLREGSATEHVLLINLPSLCIDRTAVGLLVEEIAKAYHAAQNDSRALEPMQYADYAEWQFEVLEAADEETLRLQRKLHEYSGTSPLRLLWRNSNVFEPSFDPEWLRAPVGQEICTALQALAGKFGCSIEHVWMACWETFLWRIGGNDEGLLLAAVINARRHEPLQRAIGNMTVTVPYRRVLSPEMDIQQVLRQVESTRISIEESLEYFSWDSVSGIPQYKKMPYAPVVFEFTPTRGHKPGKDFAFSLGRIDVCAEPFDLKLVVNQLEQTAELEFLYNS
ncbi:MAG: condensation domain-containing protein, partial [Candidatus Angelobacter sp.]